MLEKEKLFSKFNVKDYNTRLEEVLEKKRFNEEAENLLLSMFYKIENSYKDYSRVKVENIQINDFIENLIDIIESNCTEIEVVKPIMGKKIKPYAISRENGKITIFPNEENLLYALLKLGFKKIKPPIEYFARCMIHILENGIAASKTSVIKDFNGWSWDITATEVDGFEYNIIYNNLLLLLGYDFIINNISNKKIIECAKEKISELTDEESANDFFEKLYKVLAGIYSNENSKNRKITLQEINYIIELLQKLENRDVYIKEITDVNAKKMKQIRCIDKILTDIKVIRREFIEYNYKHSDDKVFSISDYVQKLEDDRQDRLDIISQNKDLINPGKYIKRITEIKKRLNDLQRLKLNKNKQCDIDAEFIEFQKCFLQSYNNKIIKAKTKKELIDLVYEFRYYNFLPYKKGIKLKFDNRLEELIEATGKKLIGKLIENKCIESISSDFELNYSVLKYIFNTRMISIENMHIKINKYIDKMEIEYNDTNMLEDKIEINLSLKQKINVKTDKKIKLFV